MPTTTPAPVSETLAALERRLAQMAGEIHDLRSAVGLLLGRVRQLEAMLGVPDGE